MVGNDLPNVLSGAFDWKRLGYQVHASTFEKIIGQDAGNSPWHEVICILNEAKRGKFGNLHRLSSLAEKYPENGMLVRACLSLIGDAGSDSDLQLLANFMLTDNSYLRFEACYAAQWSGVLWLIPFISEVWRHETRLASRTAIEAVISNCLDPLDPPDGRLEFFDTKFTDTEYVESIERRVSDLTQKYGSDKIPVFAGTIFSVQDLTIAILDRLKGRESSKWINWGAFLQLRHRFESNTGWDCSNFYIDSLFNPDGAYEVVDNFVKSETFHYFRPGARYFFSHCLPAS